jgi:hypothetical protein
LRELSIYFFHTYSPPIWRGGVILLYYILLSSPLPSPPIPFLQLKSTHLEQYKENPRTPFVLATCIDITFSPNNFSSFAKLVLSCILNSTNSWLLGTWNSCLAHQGHQYGKRQKEARHHCEGQQVPTNPSLAFCVQN